MSNPRFIIKSVFQKGDSYRSLLTRSILSDVCRRVTGKTRYQLEWDDAHGYNKGRMAILEYNGKRNYITFSGTDGRSRNSFFQSVPTAINQCILSEGRDCRPLYYFLPIDGEYQTPYHAFMYRMLSTVGIKFLNQDQYLPNPVISFSAVEDLIRARDANRRRNRGNSSTYITMDGRGVQIYAKVYGANKYESELFALASSKLTNSHIELFEIKEGNLRELPRPAKDVLRDVCGQQLDLIVSDMSFEAQEFNIRDSLRSPRYISNLLGRLGPKKCALCACDIPEVIQGAHIWGVSQIKRDNSLCEDEKLSHAISQHNGLWLCENHHKMFDTDIIRIKPDGSIDIRNRLTATQKEYVRDITPDMRVPKSMMSDELVWYLLRRYAA